MTDADPLPVRVHEYVADGNHDATPDEVLRECDLPKSCWLQVEHYLADTRYTMFKDREDNDASDLRWDWVEWADVANGTYDRRGSGPSLGKPDAPLYRVRPRLPCAEAYRGVGPRQWRARCRCTGCGGDEFEQVALDLEHDDSPDHD